MMDAALESIECDFMQHGKCEERKCVFIYIY
jgi:hypothetical protein